MAPDWVSHIHFCSPTHLLSHLVFSLLCSFCLSTKLYLQPFDYITHQWRGCMWGNRRNAVARSHPSLSSLVSEHLVYAALHRRQCRGARLTEWLTNHQSSTQAHCGTSPHAQAPAFGTHTYGQGICQALVSAISGKAPHIGPWHYKVGPHWAAIPFQPQVFFFSG